MSKYVQSVKPVEEQETTKRKAVTKKTASKKASKNKEK
jgi:hypothetical protein